LVAVNSLWPQWTSKPLSNTLIGRANQQEVVFILNRTQVAQFALAEGKVLNTP
jgi:hypothetical protein